MGNNSVRSSFWLSVVLIGIAVMPAAAQSFRVQCPTSTITHPDTTSSQLTFSAESAYTGPTTFGTSMAGAYVVPTGNINGAIKCQQVSGGDGYATMADGSQTFMFSFGPLSGLAKIASGQPGTDFPHEFNQIYPGTLMPGDPATTDNANGLGAFTYNGAIGLAPDKDCLADNPSNTAACGGSSGLDGHVDPQQIMNVAVMNGNIPAPLMAIDEDDEFFLTLTNVGMIMRPDLFEQHTIHFHGYPNASAFYDGVPDASVAIDIGGSFTYYYLAPDAGTYFWHCHITPPEHLQMGMVGQIYVRPRQNRVPSSMTLYAGLAAQQNDLRTACSPTSDILCTTNLPVSGDNRTTGGFVNGQATRMYAYNDGDGSTGYDVEYPLQIHGFDPNFHFVGMTFNPENFATMKDKYFLLNGRSYPDTLGGSTDAGGNVVAGPMQTETSDTQQHFSQPLPALINIPAGGKALLRLSDLDVTEYQTLASLGIPMKVVGYNAKLLRDQEGDNMAYYTNSITLGGGESLDVILDASDASCGSTGCGSSLYPAGSVFYLYTPNLDHLSNDAENFGGLMTEVHVCSVGWTPGSPCTSTSSTSTPTP